MNKLYEYYYFLKLNIKNKEKIIKNMVLFQYMTK